MKDHDKTKAQLIDELRETRQLLASIFENPRILVAYLDPQFNFIRVSRAYAQAYGREPSFFLGKNYFDLYPNAENEEIFQSVVETGETFYAYSKPFESAHTPERELSHRDWSLVSVADPEGSVGAVLLTLSSATESVQEEGFRVLVQNSSDMFSIFEADGTMRYQNPAAEWMFGYSHEEIMTKNAFELIHPDDLPTVMEVFGQVTQEPGSKASAEFRFKHKDGSWRWVEATYSNLLDNPAIAGFVANTRDITDRIRAQEALKESESRLHQAHRLAQLGHWDWYMETNELCWSEEVFDIFGQDPQSFRPTVETFEATIHPDDLDIFIAERGQALAEDRDVSIEHRVVWPDGTVRHVQELAEIIRDDEGQVVRVSGTVQDVTERVRAEEALRERTFQLGERIKELNCLFGISHLVEEPGISLEGILQGTVDLMPAAWQYPEITCARLVLEGREFRTEDFEQSTRNLSADVFVYGEKSGVLEVFFLEERPENDEGPFLKEERSLLNAVAQRLGRIIERMQAEEALKESELRYRTLFESVPVGIGIAALDGRVLAANDVMFQMTGYSEADLGQTDVRDMYQNPDDRMMLVEQLRKDGFVRNFETRLRRKDGELYHASLTVVPSNLAGKDVLLTVNRDITERVQTMQELQHYAERLRILHQVDQSILAAESPEAVAQAALSGVRDLMDCQRVSIMLFDLQACEAEVLAVHGTSGPDLPPRTRLALQDDTLELLRRGRAYVVDDIRALSRPGQRDQILQAAGMRSYVTVPLIAEGELVGSLNLGADRPDAFSSTQIVIAEQVADSLAVAIQQSRLRDQLRRQMERIEGSLREKEVLLHEVHHRVKNNLQVISSLLDMQSLYVEDPQVVSALQESRSRVRTMALIHERLYQSADLASIDTVEYVRSLVNDLYMTYNRQVSPITVKVEVADVSLGVDAAIPCGLIINELVSNALKYAFPLARERPRDEGNEIRVEIRREESGQFVLLVSDNGVGLPPDLDWRKAGSLGLRLVNRLIQQLRGTLELDRSVGTAFKITFAPTR